MWNFPIVYLQAKMIDLLNYFHFYFQLSFKNAKLDFPSESLIPVGHRALFDKQRIQIRRWEIDSRRDSIWGVLNHFHLPVHEIKVSRACVSDKSWKMKCLSTVLDSRSFPEPVTSRSVPMHVYINTCFKPWNQPSSVVWCFVVILKTGVVLIRCTVVMPFLCFNFFPVVGSLSVSLLLFQTDFLFWTLLDHAIYLAQ